MNQRHKDLAKQADMKFATAPVVEDYGWGRPAELERFAELVRADEQEAIIKIIRHLSPEIIGKANDPNTHQQWCDSASQLSRFESLIAVIKARGKKNDS